MSIIFIFKKVAIFTNLHLIIKLKFLFCIILKQDL